MLNDGMCAVFLSLAGPGYLAILDPVEYLACPRDSWTQVYINWPNVTDFNRVRDYQIPAWYFRTPLEPLPDEFPLYLIFADGNIPSRAVYCSCITMCKPSSKLPEKLIWGNEDLARGPLYYDGLNLIPVVIRNYIHNKVWAEITYSFENFNGCTVEVFERTSNFTPQFTEQVITYLCWNKVNPC